MMKKLLKKLFFVAILFLIFATAQAQDPDAFVHLRFENDLTATGSSGLTFSLTGTEVGTANLAYLSPGKEGNSTLDFGNIDASADPVDPNVPLIQNNDDAGIQSNANSGITGNAARSVTAWVRFDDDLTTSNGNYCIANFGPGFSVPDQGRFLFIVDANNGGLVTIYTAGRSTALFEGADNITRRSKIMDVVTPANSPWHHVAVTYPGTKVEDIAFYLDGVLVPNTPANATLGAGPLSTVDSPISIAMDLQFRSKWFDGGSLDDLRIYDFALTPAQVLNTFNGGNALSVGDVAFGENELKAYPNAVEDFLYLETTSDKSLQISVFDITGKNIIRSYGTSVDMSALNSGMYIVKVREDNKVANLKILKK
ncbi:putative secreted protein (Por secretion system target) [Jejuia pallidilutea]|uniref:Putative secreted protein (Por secretion system target) n=1 Tax=Jejuia pallidilutea TaxID=504487 RepID=A0A362XEC8_9FLAO|nr:LamG-like jellyroll fold domain-containing protein [Jejuia pallidilutea]PQV50220.1 putative secreted protein (Por secretion system target) [Jejuia pallidilutea]